jgi:hypothetical protein
MHPLCSHPILKVLTNMQKAILATDLVRFFGNKDQFSKIYNSGKFSWNVPQHKYVCGGSFCTIL